MNDDLLVKHLLGETSPAEARLVQEWLAADALNLAYYTQLSEVWERSRQLAAAGAVNENEAWQRFQQRVQQAAQQPQARSRRRSFFTPLRIAASVALLLGLAWLGYTLFSGGKPAVPVLVQSQQQVLSDTLPDRSVVTLNKNSSITYAGAFSGKKRTVALKGEAFFNITPDKSKPFVIDVNDVQVTVLGTSFNINGRGGKTEVVVETGLVRVTKAGSVVELKAGEKLTVDNKDSMLVKQTVTDKLYNYYRTKEFVCDNTPLWKLVEVVNGAYGVNIELGRQNLRELRISAPFYNESLNQVLEVICNTFDLKTVKKDGKIILE